MSEIKEIVKEIDWTKGIISKEEAERFVNRLTVVLLRFAIKTKEHKKVA
jgi:hypothetical protein